ncbi:hypothetical protein [Novosphingobium rhizosphaerae]|uniref:hypothetical protein n=1 Tax=Novosphingobium rhizosphaerae TaxID=1551649 RepID=UPI003D819917
MVSIAAPLAASAPSASLAGGTVSTLAGMTPPGETGGFAAFLDNADPALGAPPAVPALAEAPPGALPAPLADAALATKPELTATATLLPESGKTLPASGSPFTIAPL